MTKLEYLKKFGITMKTTADLEEEADEDFKSFVAYLAENFFHDGEDSE